MSEQTEVSDQPVSLHFTSHGEPENQTLIVLHGLFGSSTNWRSIIRSLPNELHVMSVDLRNHGESPWHADMDYPAMAEDVAWLIEQQGLVRPVILGHSMGGKVAMTVAQSELTTLGGLIIADMAPVPYEHSHLEFVDAMQSIDLSTMTSRKEVDQALASSIPDAGVRQFLLQNLVRGEESYRWRIHLDAIRSNMRGLLDYPDQPASEINTLFIGGGNSSYLSESVRPELIRQFPTSQIEMIDNAGHWLHAEQPARVVELVENFLQ